MKKRGVSPVIATVLLIGMVVVIGAIIFLWFKNMQQETITKFGETNVELICEEVVFDASYSGEKLYVSNIGNVPIYSMNVKVSKDAGYNTESIKDATENWPSRGLNQGAAFSGAIELGEGAEKIRLIPVLLGSSAKGEKTFVCEERHGYELEI